MGIPTGDTKGTRVDDNGDTHRGQWGYPFGTKETPIGDTKGTPIGDKGDNGDSGATHCSDARIILANMGSTGSSAMRRPSWGHQYEPV